MRGKSGLTEKVETGILVHIKGGYSKLQAAKNMHIPKATFYDWLARYPDFKARLEEAEARSESARAQHTAIDRLIKIISEELTKVDAASSTADLLRTLELIINRHLREGGRKARAYWVEIVEHDK